MNINNIPYSFYLNPEELEFNYKSKVFILGDSMVAGSACATKNKNLTANLNKIAKTNISVSITGVAGPKGGTKKKPVGLVYVGIKKNNKILVKKYLFKNNLMIESHY